MNVLVFGAQGKTGSLVVERALAAHHTVTIFIHTDTQAVHPTGVRVVTGDAGDLAAVQQAMVGQDAVIDTIGGKTPYKDTDLERTIAANIVQAMQAASVRRLVVVSMLGIGDSKEQTPFWYEYLLLPTFLRGAEKDKTAMEATVRSSGLDFVIARPPMLTEKPPTGSMRIIPAGETGHTITRSDLAQFLVDQLTHDQHLGQAVVIANH